MEPTAPAVAERLHAAIADHRAGRIADASAAYEAVLALAPAQFDALHLLGVIALHAGDAPRAIELLSRAVAAQPGAWPALCQLGLAHAAAGSDGVAESSFLRAIELAPDYADARDAYGFLLFRQGRARRGRRAIRGGGPRPSGFAGRSQQPGHGTRPTRPLPRSAGQLRTGARHRSAASGCAAECGASSGNPGPAAAGAGARPDTGIARSAERHVVLSDRTPVLRAGHARGGARGVRPGAGARPGLASKRAGNG